ncbi:peptidase [Micromonospora sp. NPDC023956]|uniref:peptidase n=1 Tax=Micromonospora sp. NPDC023956 TaxID=3155722 RepID=UPI0033C0DD12
MAFPHLIRRPLTLLCGLLTVLAVASPVRADDRPTTSNDEAAAGWLARQLVDGERFETVRDGVAHPAPELTLDAVLAFAAVDVADTHAARALAWVSRPDVRDAYIGDGVGESYVEPTARLALAVAVRGGDPTSVNGVDLIARLRSLQTRSGRFVDRSAHGDRSTTVGQAFAILALQRTPAGAPAAAVDFLVTSRCADLGYPLVPGQPTCRSDVDTTATVAHALLAAGRWNEPYATLTVLLNARTSSGGLRNSAGVTNAVTTALAAPVFGHLGWSIEETFTRMYLVRAQATCGDPVPAADLGAVPHDGVTLDPTTTRRATALSTLGFTSQLYGRLPLYGATPDTPVFVC